MAKFNAALVTGASGFIGRRLVQRLAQDGRRVVCLVRRTSRVDELNASAINPRREPVAHNPRREPVVEVELLEGDVTERASVERTICEAKPDVVFHLAGLVRAPNAAAFERVNADGAKHVAAACAMCEKPPVLIVVSSLAAAGPATDRPRVESDAPAPVSAYGRSKLAGEIAAAEFASTVPTTICRPPIVFGPGDIGVLELMRPIARWGIHAVPRRGDARLSLIHVDDLVSGLIAAAERGERVRAPAAHEQGMYFLAGDEQPTFLELGRMMADALGRERVRVVRIPGTLLRVAGCVGDIAARARRDGRRGWINSDKVVEALAGSWMCSPAKAKSQLGWSAAATLAQRLNESARWYRDVGWI